MVGLLLVLAATAILKAFDIELPGSGAKLSVRTVLVCLVVGTFMTWFSVIRASRRAARVPPAEAMRSVALECADQATVHGLAGRARRGRRSHADRRVHQERLRCWGSARSSR